VFLEQFDDRAWIDVAGQVDLEALLGPGHGGAGQPGAEARQPVDELRHLVLDQRDQQQHRQHDHQGHQREHDQHGRRAGPAAGFDAAHHRLAQPGQQGRDHERRQDRRQLPDQQADHHRQGQPLPAAAVAEGIRMGVRDRRHGCRT
jgi:hypothetical protein